MSGVSKRLKTCCDFMMTHNILPRDCVIFPGKQDGGDTGKDIIITRWVFESMTNYYTKSEISDFVIALLFKDRQMTQRRSLNESCWIPGWASTEYFRAIEDVYSYGDCNSRDDIGKKNILLISETLKWKVIERNPNFDNFSDFYKEESDDEEESDEEEDVVEVKASVENPEEELDDEEESGGESKTSSRSDLENLILSTKYMRDIVRYHFQRMIQRRRFWESEEGLREIARQDEMKRREKERKQSEIDAIRKRMIRAFGGPQNRAARRKARKMLLENHKRCLSKHGFQGWTRCEICGSHTMCTNCWTCVPWECCSKRPGDKFSDQCHLHGLHHNMTYYDNQHHSCARDVHIDEWGLLLFK